MVPDEDRMARLLASFDKYKESDKPVPLLPEPPGRKKKEPAGPLPAIAGLPIGDPRHGTISGYFGPRCRCEPCRRAGSAYFKRRRAQKKTKQQEELFDE